MTGEPQNVAAWLPEMAARQPETLALAIAKPNGGYHRLSARQFDALCDRAAHGLRRAGIQRGTRAVVMLPPGQDFFAVTFALFKIGAVPVLIDPGMGMRNLGRCLATARPTAFLGVPKAQAARLALSWCKETLEILVTAGPRLAWGGFNLEKLCRSADPSPFPVDPSTPQQDAAILFTSGSTGPAKGVLYTHANFAAQVRSLREVYGIQPGEVDLSTFPLFALFGPALGMCSVIPRMDASRPITCDAQDLVNAIEEFACTNMFASPALVDKLGRHCERAEIQLSSLRRVISAGAPANDTSIDRLTRHLPGGAQIHTPYGATEALPVTTIGSDEILSETRYATQVGRGVCVGSAVPGVDVAILPITDSPIASWEEVTTLPVGEIGEIAVRGPVVTQAYFEQPQATAAAKIPDQGAAWHRMGDVGYLDAADRLWMCGRKSHRVENPAQTLFTIPCEAVFNVHPAVRRSALVGVAGSPVLCIELEHGHAASARMYEELRALGQTQPHTRGIDTFLHHPQFPVDVRHNAKIFREQLAAWAAKKMRA